MASSSIHSNFTSPRFLSPKPTTLNLSKPSTYTPVRCGPRSKRGPLVRGRILSTEAILAIQSLKRVHNNKSDPTKNLPNLTRMIKSDLLSIIRELLRQDLCSLALQVLSTLRSEYPDQIDLNVYADVIFALSKNKLFDDIDRLVGDLEEGERWVKWGNDRGLLRVIRGVVEARRKESTVRICGMLRRSGCGDTWTADEYVVKVLRRGLKGMGEVELASEVETEFGKVCKGNLEKLFV
ncbi:unnamed protein product [Dovyalis caffra]|uniref:Uncharacterized protein n=1 Tax=Dovyalis caffra TaxID=77055 RepID=A0AAV1SRS1_9ROSI|nr:unnamed protein product [Dovyalis caffra]